MAVSITVSPFFCTLVMFSFVSFQARTDYAGQMTLIAGWGRTSEKGDTSRVLQSVKLPVWTQSECRAAGYSESRITDNMMCAGFKDGQKDACQVMQRLMSFKMIYISSLFLLCRVTAVDLCCMKHQAEALRSLGLFRGVEDALDQISRDCTPG